MNHANSSRIIVQKSSKRVDSIMNRDKTPKFQLIKKKSNRPNTAQSRRPNTSHVTLSKALLDKFDEGNSDETKGPSAFTNYSQESLKEFSTLLKYYPQNFVSINHFVKNHKTYNENMEASIIQKFWRNHQIKIKTQRFLSFMNKMNIKVCSVSFQKWLLATKIPGKPCIETYHKLLKALNRNRYINATEEEIQKSIYSSIPIPIPESKPPTHTSNNPNHVSFSLFNNTNQSNNSNMITPPNNSNMIAPPNKSNMITPPNISSMITPPNISNMITPPNKSNMITPPNKSNMITPPNKSNMITPPNKSNMITPPNISSMIAPPNISTSYSENIQNSSHTKITQHAHSTDLTRPKLSDTIDSLFPSLESNTSNSVLLNADSSNTSTSEFNIITQTPILFNQQGNPEQSNDQNNAQNPLDANLAAVQRSNASERAKTKERIHKRMSTPLTSAMIQRVPHDDLLGHYQRKQLESVSLDDQQVKLEKDTFLEKTSPEKEFDVIDNIQLLIEPMYLLTFEQYLKTDLLFVSTQFHPKKIVKFNKLFFRNQIRECFEFWHEISGETFQHGKKKPRIMNLIIYRKQFGPQFWTFHFWRRWTLYRKTHDFDAVEKILGKVGNFLFLFEWGTYKGLKRTYIRMLGQAKSHSKLSIVSKTTIALRYYTNKKERLYHSEDNAQKGSHLLLMRKAYLGFYISICHNRMKLSKKLRIIKAWYSITDARIIRKTTNSVFFQRKNIQLLHKVFKTWFRFVPTEILTTCFFYKRFQSGSGLLYWFLYCLKNDVYHAAYVQSFLSWKNLLAKQRNTKKFFFWALNEQYAKKQAFLRFVLNAFKHNAKIRVDRLNFDPFHIEANKENDSKVGIKDRVLFIPHISTEDTIRTIKKINKLSFPLSGKYSNFEQLSSDEVRTIFFQLLIGLAHFHSYKNLNDKQSSEKHIKALELFRDQNYLFNLTKIKLFREKQEKKFSEKCIQISRQLQRDTELINTFEIHSTALELKKLKKHFTTNSYQPGATIDLSKPEENSQDVIKNQISRAQSQSKTNVNSTGNEPGNGRSVSTIRANHPLLKGISQVKEMIDNGNTYFRRTPQQIFDNSDTNAFTRARMMRPMMQDSLSIQGTSSIRTSTYESFIPIDGQKRLYFMNQEFTIPELQNLQKSVQLAMKKDSLNFSNANMFGESPREININVRSRSHTQKVRTPQRNVLKSLLNPSFDSHKESLTKIDEAQESSEEEDTRLFDNEIEEQNRIKKLKEKPEVYYDPNDPPEEIRIILNDLRGTSPPLENLGRQFFTDPNYLMKHPNDRKKEITKRYFKILELLIGNSQKRMDPPKIQTRSLMVDQFIEIRSRISKFLSSIRKKTSSIIESPSHSSNLNAQSTSNKQTKSTTVSSISKRSKTSKDTNVNQSVINVPKDGQNQYKKVGSEEGKKALQQRKEMKKKRQELFEDPDDMEYQYSKCPEFANVRFIGTYDTKEVLSSSEMEQLFQIPEELRTTEEKPPPQSTIASIRRGVSRESVNMIKKDKIKKSATAQPSHFMTLPSAKTIVPGFDDVPPLQNVIYQAADYLEIKLEKNKENMTISDQLNLLLEIISKRIIDEQLQKDDDEKNALLNALVDMDDQPSLNLQMRESPSKKKITLKYPDPLPKFDNHQRFSTESRMIHDVPPPLQKLVFTQDLITSILEANSILQLKHRQKLNEEEKKKHMIRIQSTLQSLQNEQRDQIKQMYQDDSESLSSELDLTLTEEQKAQFEKQDKSFSAAGITKWSKPKKVKSTIEVKKVKKEKNKLGEELGEVKERMPSLLKRKPHFTKFTPSTPKQEISFHIPSRRRPQTQQSKTPTRFQWEIKRQKVITDNDIELFMYITPYVLSDEIIETL